MANQSLEEILSRLNILGATQTGGTSAYANYLAVLNSNGQLNSSLFESTLTVHQISAQSDLLSLDGQTGDLSVLPNDSAYVYISGSTSGYTSGPWVQIGAIGSGTLPFVPDVGSPLSSSNVQSAINELTGLAVLKDANTGDVIKTVTFNAVDGSANPIAPFAIGDGSAGIVVVGLNAEKLGGYQPGDFFNASNLASGTVPSGRLSGTYGISITGDAATLNSQAGSYYTNAANLTGTIASARLTGTYAISVSGSAAQLGGNIPTYYTDIGNLNAGGSGHVLSGSLFSDASHGARAGGSLHAAATDSTAGFISAADKTKLDGITAGAQPNQNAFANVSDGTSTIAAASTSDTVNIQGGGSGTSNYITSTANNSTRTVTLDFNLTNVDTLIDNRISSSSALADAIATALTGYVSQTATGQTISGRPSFNPTTAGTSPFIVGTNGYGINVPGLNASLLQGYAATYFTDFRNISFLTGTNTGFTSAVTSIVNAVIPSYSFASLTTTGDLTVGGALTVSGQPVFSILAGIATSPNYVAVGVDATGGLYTINADSVPTGATNKYFTTAGLYASFASVVHNYSMTHGSGITWTSGGGGTYYQPVLALNADDVSTSGTTNQFLTLSTLNTILASGSSLQANLKSILNGAVVEYESGAVAITTPTTVAGTLGITGDVTVTGSGAGVTAPTFYNTALGGGSFYTPTLGNELTNKHYVDTQISAIGSPAVYDLPVWASAALTSSSSTAPAKVYPSNEIGVGQVVNITGTLPNGNTASYQIINTLPGTSSGDWVAGAGSVTTTANSGFITSIEFGNLLKATNLVNTPAEAVIFLPDLRLNEPVANSRFAGNSSLANDNTNANWRRKNRNGVQVRGRKNKNYLTLLRIQGWISLRHNWTLSYFTYDGTTYQPYTYQIQAASNSQPGGGDQPYAYVDQYFGIVVGGRSTVTLEYEAADATITQNTGSSFDAVAPLAGPNTTGNKPYFNGGFLNIAAQSVFSANPNEPFAPYVPDLLPVQSEGDIISGGLTSYPSNVANDNRIYDGEDINDNQNQLIGLVRNTVSDSPEVFYSVATSDQVPTTYEKPCVRCNGPVVNKYTGVTGFIRANPFVSSGVGLTARLAPSNDAFNELTLTQLNTKVAQPLTLPLTTFNILGASAGGSPINIVPLSGSSFNSVGDIVSAVNAFQADCDNGSGDVLTHYFAMSYDATTDRVVLQVNCNTLVPNISYSAATDPVAAAFRLVYGPGATQTGHSLPVASGINITAPSGSIGSALLTSLNLNQILETYSGDIGLFSVDGVQIPYYLTTFTSGLTTYTADTFATLQTRLATAGYDLQYDGISNEFVLKRLAAQFTDSEAILPPRAYDITGNLMIALGLEKESHGNTDFPASSVHSILPVTDGLILAGNFRSYNTSTSPGIAKIKLSGELDAKFVPGIGFSGPTYALAPVLGDSTGDIFVAPLNAASYQGYNNKSLFRITPFGKESATNEVLAQPISGDNQERVLSVISASNGDFIVVTPRTLNVYSSGALVRSYTASKSLHGAVKYKDSSSQTYFVLSSTVVSAPAVEQTITLQDNTSSTVGDTTTIGGPSGLRLLVYNQSTQTITLDTLWEQSTGAGVGASTSCAYPVIGGLDSTPYVLCGNRAGWWGTGMTNESGADWSWNYNKKGNLLYDSENLSDGTYWTTNGAITTSTNTGTSPYQTTLTLTDGTLSGSSYIQQEFNAQYYQPTGNVSATNANPGGVVYEFDCEVGLFSSAVGYYAYLVLDFSDNSNPDYEFSVGAKINLNATATTRVIEFGPNPSPDSSVVVSSSYVDEGGSTPTKSIIKLAVKDTTPANLTVTCRIYPAYSTSASTSDSSPVSGTPTLNIFRTALRYDADTWSQWGPSSSNGFTFDDVYVKTTSTLSIPSGTGSNSNQFIGLYKIALEPVVIDSTTYNRGAAYPAGAFSLSAFGFSEPQSHAIPFGTDSSDNIYVGGPINSIGGNTVVPWRIYKLTSAGVYDPTDSFNQSINVLSHADGFNDRVTSCVVTDTDYLVIAGTFSCFNGRPANQLVFLDTAGNPIDNIDPAARDVIEQATIPTDPSLFTKLWMDTSTVPPILKVYDAAASPAGWVNIIQSNSQLGQPYVVVDPTNAFNAGTITDPKTLKIGVNSAYTLISAAADLSTASPSSVRLLATLDGNQVINGVIQDIGGGNWGDPDISPSVTQVAADSTSLSASLTLPNSTDTIQNLTLYVQLIPGLAMKTKTVTSVAGSTVNTTTTPSFVAPSPLLTESVSILPAASTPALGLSGNTVSITNLDNANYSGYYYMVLPYGTPTSLVPTSYNSTDSRWLSMTTFNGSHVPTTNNSFTITTSSDVYVAHVYADNSKGSAINNLDAGVTFGNVAVTVLANNTIPASNYIYFTATPPPAYSSNVLTGSGSANVSDGDTVTIGTTVYRFKNTMSAAYDVKIAGSGNSDTSLNNLIAAINGTGTAGTNWYAGTVANTLVSASTQSAHKFTITALAAGSVSLSVGTTASVLAWGSGITGTNFGSTFGTAGTGIMYTTDGTDPKTIVITNSTAKYLPFGGGNVATMEVINVAALLGATGTIKYRLVTIPSTSTGTITPATVVDWSTGTNPYQYKPPFSATPTFSGSNTVPGLYTLDKSTADSTPYVYLGNESSGYSIYYTIVAHNTPAATTAPTSIAYASSNWYIDLSTLGSPIAGYLTSDLAAFDVIAYAGYTPNTTTAFPSVEFFTQTASNIASGINQPGALVTFTWTNTPPTITLSNDSTYGITGFSVSRSSSGSLYYTLDGTVPTTSSTPIVDIAGSFAVNFVAEDATLTGTNNVTLQSVLNQVNASGTLVINVIEVAAGETAPNTVNVSQISTSSPYTYVHTGYPHGSSPVVMLEYQVSSNYNLINYGQTSPWFTVTQTTATDAVNNASRTVTPLIKYAEVSALNPPNLPTWYNTAFVSSEGTAATSGGFSPSSTGGGIMMGVMLYAPSMLPSRLISYLINYAIPKVTPTVTGGSTRQPSVELVCTGQSTADIYYTLDGSYPNTSSLKYTGGSTGFNLFADAVVNSIAVPATNSNSLWIAGAIDTSTVTIPAGSGTSFPDDYKLGLINIAFGDPTDERYASDVALSLPELSSQINCPIGNSVLNLNTDPNGFGFSANARSIKNCYWNSLNNHGFSNFIELRDANGGHNTNNVISARPYLYGCSEFDLSSMLSNIAGSGIGTTSAGVSSNVRTNLYKHLYTKGIVTNSRTASTLAQIRNLPAGKYAVFAMTATTVNGTTPLSTTLDIQNQSANMVILSNISASNPAFYFNAQNPYASDLTTGLAVWQVALIETQASSVPGYNASAMSFDIVGVSLMALQIVPVVEFIQPQVMSNPLTNGSGIKSVNEMVYPSLPAGNYSMMYLHGAVLLPESPGFTGQGYTLTHSITDDSTPGTSVLINPNETVRYTNNTGISKYYSGSTVMYNILSNGTAGSAIYKFDHTGGAIKLGYSNDTILNGDYSAVQVMSDTYNFPYAIGGANPYPYIAHTSAYTVGSAGLTSTQPIIAPIFALIDQDAIDDNTYPNPPIMIPSQRTAADLSASIYGGQISMFCYPNTQDGLTSPTIHYTLGTSGGTTVPSSGSTGFTVGTVPPTPITPNSDGAGGYYPTEAVTYISADNPAYSPITVSSYPTATSLFNTTGSPLATYNFLNGGTYGTINSIATGVTATSSAIVAYGNNSAKVLAGTGFAITGVSEGSATADTSLQLTTAGPVYNGSYYQLSVNAPYSEGLTVTGIGALLVYSQPVSNGVTNSYITSSRYFEAGLTGFALFQSFLAAHPAWTDVTGNNNSSSSIISYDYGNYYQAVTRTVSYQQVTGGGNRVQVQCSPFADFSSRTTLISDTSIQQSGQPWYVTGTSGDGGFNGISGVTDISSDINAYLAASPISIAAGTSLYIRIIPYNSLDTANTFALAGAHGLASADLTILGTTISETVSSGLVNTRLSTSVLTGSDYTLPNDQTSPKTITIELYDMTGTLITSGYTVALTSDYNSGSPSLPDVITGPTVTSGSGYHRYTFVVNAGLDVDQHVSRFYATATNTGTSAQYVLDNSISLQTTGAVPATRSAVASPTKVLADGTNTTTITFTVIDYTGSPVSGLNISYAGVNSVASGSLSGVAVAFPSGNTTNSFGIATCTVSSTTVGAGTLKFLASDGSPFISNTITTMPVPSNTLSTLTFNKSIQAADGINYITATITLLDATSTPIDGSTYAYLVNPVANANCSYTDGMGAAITGGGLVPSSSGVVTYRVYDATAETFGNITATVGLPTGLPTTTIATVSSTVSLTFQGINAAFSTVVKSPSSGTVSPDGSSAYTLTVTLVDSNLDVISGKVVTMAQASGSGVLTINSTTGTAAVTTNSSGVAVFTITTTVADTYTLNVQDYTDSSAYLTSPSIVYA